MNLSFKYIPLTFLKEEAQIKEQIRNTIILKYFFNRNRRTKKLQEFIEGTQYGYNASALQSGINKFLRISDITDGKVDWDSVPYCDCLDESTYLLKNDDLLIARTGGTTGKSFLISNPPKKAIFAGYLIRIRANEANNSDFLNLFLNSYVYWSQIVSINKGDFRPSVNASKLKSLVLPICSLSEQLDAIKISKGIATSGYEDLELEIEQALLEFDNCKKMIFELKNQNIHIQLLKQAILQEAIQGKLTEDWREKNSQLISGENSSKNLLKKIKAEKARLVKEKKIKKEKALAPISKGEIPFELPEGWIWCRLGEIIINSDNLNIHNELSSQDLINYVDIDSIDNRLHVIRKPKLLPVRELSSRARRVLKKGQIMYSLVRPYLHNLAIVEKEKPNLIGSTGFAVFSCLFVENKYIFWLLLSKYIENIYMDFMDGFNSPSITHDQFRTTKIPLPPFEEQKAIVEKVEQLMQKCQALEEEIKQSETNAQMLMQAVLKEAFEGEKKENHVLI